MAKKKEKPARRRIFRLLPITVTMLSLLFIIKLNEVYIGSQHLREMYGVRDASAEDKQAEAKPADPAKPAPTPAAEVPNGTGAKPVDALGGDTGDKADAINKDATAPGEALKQAVKDDAAKDAKDAKPAAADAAKAGEAKPEDAKKEGEKKDEAKKEGEKPAEGKEGEKKEEAKKEGDKKEGDKKPEEPKTYGTGKSTIKEIEAMKAKDANPRFSKTEVDLLENLSKRRDELDQREKDLEIKARVLDATEKRISDKMTEMKTLQSEVSKVLAQYNEKQDAQIKSLVKIYESMKPDEAAAIMNELEMPILLEVIGKMSERKVALVLANMNPKRARDVTQELAEKRKKAQMNAAIAGQSAPPAPAGKP